jgi:hypothetical protein
LVVSTIDGFDFSLPMKIQNYLPSKIRRNSNLTVLGHKVQGDFQNVFSIKPLNLGQSVNPFRNSTGALNLL